MMIRCRTVLDRKTIKALAEYDIRHKPGTKRKRRLMCFLGVVLLILSLINAYGYWLKYYGIQPVFIILLKSSVFVLLSLIIIITGFKGAQHNLYRELKQYFAQINADYMDYIISENGIQLILNHHATMYQWDVIDHMESDADYYYFSSNGKHSIISKEPISSKNRQKLENLMIKSS